MSESSTEKKNEFFQFNWAAFNTIAGLKYAVAILIVMLLTAFTDFNFINIMIAAFLAWLTDVPGTTKNRVGGMAVFAVTGVAMIWLATAVSQSVFYFTLAIFLVGFLFTLPMAISLRGYMVGWVTILLFFSIALLTSPENVVSVTIDHLIGVSIVVVITLLWPASIGPYGRVEGPAPAESGGVDDHPFVLVYALTVAVVLAAAIFVGMKLFPVGSVWAANGAFFVLGPSTQQSWIHGIERAVVVVIGIVLGLLLVQFIGSTLIQTVLVTFFAFLALAALNAGYAISIGSYTAGMTMTWAWQGLDAWYLNASERILAEAFAIGLAIAATAFLQWWSTHRRVETFVEAEIAT